MAKPEVAPISKESNIKLKSHAQIADDRLRPPRLRFQRGKLEKKKKTLRDLSSLRQRLLTSHALCASLGTAINPETMQDDLILVVLIIKVFCPSLICLPPSWSAIFGACLDWSVLMAAYRLAAIISALVN